MKILLYEPTEALIDLYFCIGQSCFIILPELPKNVAKGHQGSGIANDSMVHCQGQNDAPEEVMSKPKVTSHLVF